MYQANLLLSRPRIISPRLSADFLRFRRVAANQSCTACPAKSWRRTIRTERAAVVGWSTAENGMNGRRCSRREISNLTGSRCWSWPMKARGRSTSPCAVSGFRFQRARPTKQTFRLVEGFFRFPVTLCEG